MGREEVEDARRALAVVHGQGILSALVPADTLATRPLAGCRSQAEEARALAHALLQGLPPPPGAARDADVASPHGKPAASDGPAPQDGAPTDDADGFTRIMTGPHGNSIVSHANDTADETMEAGARGSMLDMARCNMKHVASDNRDSEDEAPAAGANGSTLPTMTVAHDTPARGRRGGAAAQDRPALLLLEVPGDHSISMPSMESSAPTGPSKRGRGPTGTATEDQRKQKKKQKKLCRKGRQEQQRKSATTSHPKRRRM